MGALAWRQRQVDLAENACIFRQRRMRSHAGNPVQRCSGGRRNGTPTRAVMAMEVSFLADLQKYPLYR